MGACTKAALATHAAATAHRRPLTEPRCRHGSTRCSGAKYARLITGGTGAVCIAAYDGLLPLGARSWNYSYSDWGTQTEAYARLGATEPPSCPGDTACEVGQ